VTRDLDGSGHDDADIGLPSVGGAVKPSINTLGPAVALVAVESVVDLARHITERWRYERRLRDGASPLG